MTATDVKSLIKECIDNEKPFKIIDDSGRCWTDIIYGDANNDTFFRFIAKWNSTGLNIEQPTFGKPLFSQGLVEIDILYSKIIGVVQMEVSDDLLETLKEESPDIYNFWKNGNKIDGVVFKDTRPGLEPSDAYKQWEQSHKAELDERNRTSAIGTGFKEKIDAVQL